MQVYLLDLIVFIIGYLLLHLDPSLEPFFLLKTLFITPVVSDLEMYIIRILNIVGLVMVIYPVIMIVKNRIKNK